MGPRFNRRFRVMPGLRLTSAGEMVAWIVAIVMAVAAVVVVLEFAD